MRQAITTKYHGPTNTRGSRISATSASGIRVYMPYSYDLSVDECHEKAAEALCTKLGWTGQMIGGSNTMRSIRIVCKNGNFVYYPAQVTYTFLQINKEGMRT